MEIKGDYFNYFSYLFNYFIYKMFLIYRFYKYRSGIVIGIVSIKCIEW